MAGIYGHKWSASYGMVPDEGWALILRDVTPQQIAVGIGKCITSNEAWPPSAPEFRAMCLGLEGAQDTDWEHRRIEAANKAFDESRALVKLPETEEQRNEIADKFDLNGMFR